MFTLRKLFAVIATMAIAVLVTPGNATAATYPDCLDISVVVSDPQTVVGGDDVTISASADSNVGSPSGVLTIKVLGHTYTFNGNSGSKTISTPVVSAKEVHDVVASFTPDDTCDAAGAAAVSAAAFLTPEDAHSTLTLLPEGVDDEGANLPNTGGTNLWYIVWGAAFLGLGVAIIGTVNSRRTKKIL